MTQEGVYEPGDTITIDDGVTLKAELADTDGSGCYVCDNGTEKCYFAGKDRSELPCPKCHSDRQGFIDHVGSRVIFLQVKNKIYSIPNPLWLSDTFVFGQIDNKYWCYIKINHANEIEEIGYNIAHRMHYGSHNVQSIIDRDDCKEATKLQCDLFKVIGDELWYHYINKANNEQRK